MSETAKGVVVARMGGDFGHYNNTSSRYTVHLFLPHITPFALTYRGRDVCVYMHIYMYAYRYIHYLYLYKICLF